MITQIKNTALNLIDSLAWKTNKKIIVFESDDWGSIRMPSKDVYNKCIKDGYQVDQNIFSRYDSLASEDDLNLLFDLLLKYKDIAGNHPSITANCLVANPNFDKIRENNFETYEYELITETFKKYPKHQNCFDIWMKGKELGVFVPQSHGREHLNVSRFMTDLKNKDPHAQYAFENKMPGIFDPSNVADGNNYVVALEYKDKEDEIEKCRILDDGLSHFTKLFGYHSKTFIATNYIWSALMEETLAANNVKALQGSRFQNIPKGQYRGFRRKLHYTGQKNKLGQLYFARNVYFEPSLNSKKDWVNDAIFEIEKAFNKRMPALVSTHRINFVGHIDEKNRDRSLRLFDKLLQEILRKWPEVEFMSSDQLYDQIQNTTK